MSRRFHEAVLRVFFPRSWGPQLFVITVQAATSRSRSSQILVGWWSAQRNDYRSPLVELADNTNGVKGKHTERDHRSG
jgi:hypothetical protein